MLRVQLNAVHVKPTLLSFKNNVVVRAPKLSTPVRTISVSAPHLQADKGVYAKYKMKTRKSIAKRFKITGSGRVMARRPGKQHLNEKKSRKRVKRQSHMFVLKDSDVKRGMQACLPYAKLSRTGQHPKGK